MANTRVTDITLGAFCQKKFNLADGFDTVFARYDPSHVYVLRRAEIENETLLPVDGMVFPVGPGIVEERIELSLIANGDTRFWCGYSSRVNTLCIMEEPSLRGRAL